MSGAGRKSEAVRPLPAPAPITGWAALLFHERTESLEQEVRANLSLRQNPNRTFALRDVREDIETEIQQRLEQGQQGTGTS